MASIASSTNIGSSASSIRGYGGLASGLDRDSLIEGMTAATRAKIAKQQQKKQTYAWEQEAYRSISDKLVQFSRKYTSYTSSTNLSGANFWARSGITALGSNSKFINVSGSSSVVDNLSIVGVKQMAKDATMSSNNAVSDQTLNTGDINLINKEDVSNLEGQYLYFKYGTKTVSVSLSSGTNSEGFTYDYSTAEKAKESITKCLQNVSVGNGKTMADVLTVETTDTGDGDFKVNLKTNSDDTSGNTLMLTGGSQTILNALGIGDIKQLNDAQRTLSQSGFSQGVLNKQSMFTAKSFAERMGGKSVSFTYNGTTKSITFASQKEIEDMIRNAGGNQQQAMNDIADDLQGKLDQAFGTGRISVKAQSGTGAARYQLSFETTIPGTGQPDKSSILALSSGDTGTLGKFGALKVEYGESNRVNLTSSMENSGLKNIKNSIDALKQAYQATYGKAYDSTYFSGAIKTQELIDALGDEVTDSTTPEELKKLISDRYNGTLSDTVLSKVNDTIDYFEQNGVTNVKDLSRDLKNYVDERELKININGVDIKGISYDSTLNDMINKINASDAKVKISYMKNADKFSIVSTDGGASGAINIGGSDAAMIFGTAGTDYTITEGQDAIIGVKYTGSDEVVELHRGSNAFNLDGLNITVSGTFGYKYDSAANGSYVKTDDGNYEEIDDPSKRYTYNGSSYVLDAAGTHVLTKDGNYVNAANGFFSLVQDPQSEEVTFDAKVDSDKIVDAVKDMIKDLNEIIQLVNDEVSTKPNRDYAPLTDEQKEELTEEQIEKWEKKAKAGSLFGDSDLRGLSDKLRFIFNTGSEEKSMLESFGISTSTNYSDNGKLVLDETKFRAALETNAEDLKELFTKTANTTTGEKGGFMARLTVITEKYASTSGATKGILIEKAGSTYAPTSILTNYLQKSIDSVDDYIERLQDQLETEQDRYISQFTTLETLISQMNSQSSWLSSSFG